MILLLKNLLNAEQLTAVDAIIEGGTFGDGGESAGSSAGSVKRNLELDREKTPDANIIETLVVGVLSVNSDFSDYVMPKQFSRPLVSRYQDGMEYGRHVDNPLLMGPISAGTAAMRTDVSVTVFLSDPADYDGGELILEIEGEERPLKLARGDAVAYTTGTTHRVAPVTRGARTCAIVWAESIVADPHRREILSEFHRVHHALVAKSPDTPETETFLKAYYNLVRLWGQS